MAMTPQELAQTLASMAADRRSRADLAEELLRLHRTEQQRIFGLCLDLIEGWAQAAEANDFDLRNEATVRMCQRIVDTLPELPGGRPPLI